MMTSIKYPIILHGKPSKNEYYDPNMPSQSNANWLPWLQSQLLKHDIAAVTPDVPNAFDPKWETWVREVERFELTPETLVVGHSCGGGFWVRYLSQNKNVRVGKVVLVAPWTDPDGNNTKGFFDFDIDLDLIDRTKGVTIFHSDNDMGNVQKTVALLREALPDIGYREFHNYGHFVSESMKSDQFPELLEELLVTD